MDPSAQFSLDVSEAARMRRAAAALITEGAERMAAAEARERAARRGGHSIARALNASGSFDWTLAPNERADSDRLAQQYGRAPRSMNGFFIDAGLQTRTLTAGAVTGSYLVETARPLAIEAARASNSFLDLCTVIRPTGATGNLLAGKLSTAPTVVMLASETTNIGEVSPTATQSIVTPRNAATFIQESRQFALQVGDTGARAIANLLTNALRTKVGQQILTGTGSNGEALGLCNDSTIATASGTTIAYSTIASTQ